MSQTVQFRMSFDNWHQPIGLLRPSTSWQAPPAIIPGPMVPPIMPDPGLPPGG